MGANPSQYHESDLKYHEQNRYRKIKDLMRSCVALNCPNQQVPLSKQTIRFFTFPRNEDMAKKWIQFSKRTDIVDVSNLRVCSDHFTEWNRKYRTTNLPEGTINTIKKSGNMVSDSAEEEQRDPSKICRICLSATNPVKPLFERDGKSIATLKMIENTLQIKVKDFDYLPTEICLNCLNRVRNMNKFITDAKTNQLALLERHGYLEEKEKDSQDSENKHSSTKENKTRTDEEISIKSIQNNFEPTIYLYETEAFVDEDSEIQYEIIEEIVEDGDEEELIEEEPIMIVETAQENLKKEIEQNKKRIKRPRMQGFPCKKCNLFFTNKDEYFDHKSKHYQCETCGHYFEFEFLLKRHSRSHLSYEEALHSCKTCGFKVKSMNQLQSHMAEVHPEELKFECDVCGRRFNSQTNAKIHKIRVHAPVLPCKICGVVVKNHKKHSCNFKGSFNCPICHKEFKNKLTVQTHIYKIHKERSHPIDFSILQENSP